MAKGHQDKIAVITGAPAIGIGQAYAQRLAEDGVHVVVADMLPGEDTAALVRAAGGRRSPCAATCRRPTTWRGSATR